QSKAEAFNQPIQCVICLHEAMGDRAAIAFAIGFYDALGANRSIEEAFEFGCMSIQLEGVPEELTPVLLKKVNKPATKSIKVLKDIRADGDIIIRVGNITISGKRPDIAPIQLKRNPNKYFVGRKEALKNLETQLSKETRLAITAIKGMGGIGKTELALQYAIAARKNNRYPGGICWIDVRGKDVADEILDFANTHLDFIPPDKQSSGQEIDLAKKVQACWNLWSQAFPEEKLVIFDDVAAYDQVKDFLPPYDPSLKVIITTRLRLQPLNIASLVLEVLEEEDALNLLEAYIGKKRLNNELDDAKKLCEWVGNLPLGLNLVGRYLREFKEDTLLELLEQLKKKGLDQAAMHETPIPIGNGKTTTDLWDLWELKLRLHDTVYPVTYEIVIVKSQDIVTIGGEVEISINLKQVEITKNKTFLLQIPYNETIANELNIILNAPGFQLNGDNTASLPLDSDTTQETQTACFRLTALRPGNATITAELYRGDTFETKLDTQIQVADIDEATFTPQRITTQPRPVPQPDFILRIQTIWNGTNSTYKFQYQLKSFRFPSIFPGNNIYTSDSFSSSWLEQMREWLATTLKNISGSLPTEGKSCLISLGQYLFEQVFPTELQSDFRSLIPQNSTFTLLILTDQEAWIPWELLYDGQRFLGDRFIIGRWLQELNDTRPYEFPVGTVNVAHYANVEQPQLWATLLEALGAPPPQPLPAGVLHDSTEAIRGLHLIRYSQSSDADLRNAPVTLDNINDTEDIELQMRPAKLNLRRNRSFVTLSYVKIDAPELTALENTWASAFIRAGCSGFTGSLWAVEPAVEAAFISCFYNRLWAGASLNEAFYTSRQLARAAAPDSLDWLAYVLFGDPMARPYRPVPGDGYAIVEPIGLEIDDPLPPGAIARFRVTLRRNPPVWHEDRVIEVAENLVFENLQVHIVTYGLQVIPDLPVTMTLTAKGDYLGWFTLVVPNEITDTSALVQVYFADGMRPIHSLNFSLNIENGREE
ncbi:MAG: NB-ARC domain-containing protein, partial [Nostoc sp.]